MTFSILSFSASISHYISIFHFPSLYWISLCSQIICLLLKKWEISLNFLKVFEVKSVSLTPLFPNFVFKGGACFLGCHPTVESTHDTEKHM